MKKVVKARPEAQRWLEQCQDLEKLAIGVRRELKARAKERQNGRDATKHEIAIERVLRSSVRRCEKCLKQMTSKLRPLDEIDDDKLMKGIPQKCKFVFEQDFIDAQQNQIDRQIRNISLAFHLLDYSDRRSERTERQIESARLQQTLHLLEQRLANLERTNTEGQSGLVSDSSPTIPEVDERGRSPPADAGHDSSGEENLSTNLDDSDSDASTTDSRNVSRESIIQVVRPQVREAIQLNDIDATKALLSEMEDAELCVQDSDNWTLLHYAVLAHPKIMYALLKRSSVNAPEYLNAQNNSKQTALMDACKKADSQSGRTMIEMLLEHGADIKIKDGINRTALHFTIARPPDPDGNADMVVEMLLKQGCEVTTILGSDVEERVKHYPALKARLQELKED